ncbi:GNAT family N-acetyltransferase [Streptomyces sp. CRN 30]|uniref:GNAT family N-acetyltransferase n=1 Tax=Streptomyces sp. CRN 30 TaxID=3075613 RepID=UPI002A8386C6|nr:GNAT family N-acetyltransferase [Streptomyces sp. CRN 30]
MSVTFRALDPLRDAELVHGWVTHPRTTGRWMARDAKLVDVERACMRMAADEHRRGVLGLRDGEPAFLMETFEEAGPGDLGLRFLTPPTRTPGDPSARSVLTAVLAHLFEDPAVGRVVVEADVDTAVLGVCTREQFFATTTGVAA